MDELLRILARGMHGGHSYFALALLFYYWMTLGYMVTFYATMPILSFLAHIPPIIGMGYVRFVGLRHLKRQRDMTFARLV